MRSADDLTARARIRAAAMLRFGRDGLGVGLRQVAADAGVSPALVLHHFGSKEGLRAACDAYVHDQMRNAKAESLDQPASELLAQLAGVERYAPLVAYLLRVVLDGGPGAAAFVDGLVADTVAYLEHGEQVGLVRPTTDPEARARQVVAAQLGLLLLTQLDSTAGRAPSPTTDPGAALAHIALTSTDVSLDIYTHGLFTDATYLDTWRAAAASGPHPPSGTAPAVAGTHPDPHPATPAPTDQEQP